MAIMAGRTFSDIGGRIQRSALAEHFYDPSVGGDTESRHAFEAYAGGESAEGDIDDWLPMATMISIEGNVDVEDYSDYEIIDWARDNVQDGKGKSAPSAESNNSG